MRFLSQIKHDFTGQTCLLRVDFNVENTQNALRLEAVLPTIKFLLKKKARVVILSHRGRPNRGLTQIKRRFTQTKRGFTRKGEEDLSLRFAIPFLQKHLGQKVYFLRDLPSESVSSPRRSALRPAPSRFAGLVPGSSQRESAVFLLENLRFWPGEEKNDLEFAKKLVLLGDFYWGAPEGRRSRNCARWRAHLQQKHLVVDREDRQATCFYVNDAFGVCHRRNASVTQLPKLLPSYAGLLLEKEIKNLSAAMIKPQKPLVIIFGGAKVQDKAPAIKNLLTKANAILLGSSAIQSHNLQYLQKMGLLKSPKVMRPIDWLSDKNSQPMDIGPMTIEDYLGEIKKAKTIIWNGPVGYFEDKRFTAGSEAIARAIAKSRAKVIIGGGETVAFFQKATRGLTRTGTRLPAGRQGPRGIFVGVSQRKVGVSLRLFLSTGGGAMLEFLSGRNLPGIKALE